MQLKGKQSTMSKSKRIGLKPTEEERKMDAQMQSNHTLRLKNIKLERQVKEANAHKRIVESALEKTEQQLEIISGILGYEEYSKTTRKIISPDFRHKNEATAFILLSDIHGDEEVTLETTNGWNKSNPDITVMKLNTFREGLLKTVREMRKGISIPHLVFGILGDTITGYIHEENLENNLMSPTQGIMMIKPILIDTIKTFSEDGDFKSIKVIMIRGNHGRTTKKKRYSTAYKNSYEWQMYIDIATVFREQLVGYDNVEFFIPKSFMEEIEVYGKKITFSHGDHWNYRGGIGGVEIPMRSWSYREQKAAPADRRYFGHWHTWTPGKETINGSCVGYNPFAMEKGFEPEPPLCHFELLDRNRSMFTVKLPIILHNLYK